MDWIILKVLVDKESLRFVLKPQDRADLPSHCGLGEETSGVHPCEVGVVPTYPSQTVSAILVFSCSAFEEKVRVGPVVF